MHFVILKVLRLVVLVIVLLAMPGVIVEEFLLVDRLFDFFFLLVWQVATRPNEIAQAVAEMSWCSARRTCGQVNLVVVEH